MSHLLNRGEYGTCPRCAEYGQLGAADGLREIMSSPLSPADRVEYSRTVAEARARLGEEGFVSAWSAGRVMTLEQAIEYALKESNEPTS